MRRASRRSRGGGTRPTPERMGPSDEYLCSIRAQMELLDEAPEFVARAVHEFGVQRGLSVRSQAELDRLLSAGQRPKLAESWG